jgi:hypothetical protein
MEEDWQRVAALIDGRRTQLGMSKADLYRESGLSETKFRLMANGVPVAREGNRRSIESAIAWAPGSLDAALAGEDPTPIDALNVASELRELRVAIESLVRQVAAVLESLPPSPPHP